MGINLGELPNNLRNSKKKKAPKPIFVMGVPERIGIEEISRMNIDLPIKLRNEYHFIAHPSTKEDFTFDMFSTGKIEPIDLEELKEIVLEKIKSNGKT